MSKDNKSAKSPISPIWIGNSLALSRSDTVGCTDSMLGYRPVSLCSGRRSDI